MSRSTQLMADERPVILARQHWSVVAPWIAAGVIAFVACIVVLVLIPASIGGRNIGGLKVIIAFVLAVFLIGWAGLHYLRWRLTTYLLTNRRVILERGVLSRWTESISLDRIQNTVIRRPLGDRLIGAGNIEIESAGRDGVEILHRVPNAQAFYASLMQECEALRLGAGTQPPRSI